jgi:hypothetical protein
VTTALPVEADPAVAVMASAAVVGPVEPTAGQTRTALDTAARLDSIAP